jgi:hypothetical protein
MIRASSDKVEAASIGAAIRCNCRDAEMELVDEIAEIFAKLEQRYQESINAQAREGSKQETSN